VNLYFNSETVQRRWQRIDVHFFTASPDGIAIDIANLVMFLADEVDGQIYVTYFERSG